MTVLWQRAVLVLMMLAGAAVQAESRTSKGELVERRELPGAKLVALADDQLLAWNSTGMALLRTASGVWNEKLTLAVTDVTAVIPDGHGFLAAGSRAAGIHQVVLFDRTAGELRRWTVPEPVFELLVDGSRRWASQREGLTELLADGRIGTLEPYPEPIGHGARLTPRVIQHDGKKLVCYGADLSLAGYAWANCQSAEGHRWTIPDADMAPATGCGAWVINREGRKLNRIVVRSYDGAIVGRHTYRAVPTFACAGPDAIVVGTREVQLLRLPSLTPIWGRTASGAGAREVAATRRVVAYAAEDSSAVIVLPR